MAKLVESINQSQSQAITDLSQRQTDLFTLATKFRVQQGFNNESIQIWYDAKANVTSIISKLKLIIHEKMQSLINQSIKPSSSWLDQQKIQKKNNHVDQQQFSDMVFKFEDEFKKLKKQSIDYQKSVSNLDQALKATEEAISKNSQMMKQDLRSMYQTLMNYNQTNNQNQNSDMRQSSGRQENTMSPFDKRLGSYTKGALSRSNSRGPVSPLG